MRRLERWNAHFPHTTAPSRPYRPPASCLLPPMMSEPLRSGAQNRVTCNKRVISADGRRRCSPDGKHIQNDLGTMAIRPESHPASPILCVEPYYQFAFDEQWLRCNNRRVLWLPLLISIGVLGIPRKCHGNVMWKRKAYLHNCQLH